MFWKTLDNLNEDNTNIINPIQMSNWFDYLSELYSDQNKEIELKKKKKKKHTKKAKKKKKKKKKK